VGLVALVPNWQLSFCLENFHHLTNPLYNSKKGGDLNKEIIKKNLGKI
jgi:hypothetical protein